MPRTTRTPVPHNECVGTRELDKSIAILKVELAGRATALELQAKEYERRLADLNHAHDKAQADRGDFVSKVAYEPWKESVTIALAEARGRAATLAATYAVASSIVVGFIMMAVSHYVFGAGR